jgi:hypothetical protein
LGGTKFQYAGNSPDAATPQTEIGGDEGNAKTRQTTVADGSQRVKLALTSDSVFVHRFASSLFGLVAAPALALRIPWSNIRAPCRLTRRSRHRLSQADGKESQCPATLINKIADRMSDAAIACNAANAFGRRVNLPIY